MCVILLFGASGLLGKYVFDYLESKNFTIISISKHQYNIISDCFQTLENIILKYKPSILINCTNSFKDDLETQLKINSYFPHQLSNLAIKYHLELIHISTNGVFLGDTEYYYSENDIPDANDHYGITKILGENIPFTVIRTSIIGETKRGDHYFIEWLKKSTHIKGFINHYWNGVTCLYLAQYIEHIIVNNLFWVGIRHVCDEKIYTKFDLAILIKKIYKLNLFIEETESTFKNLSLKTCYKNTFRKPNLEMDLLEQKQKGNYISKLTCRFCNNYTKDILHLGNHFGLAGGFLKDLTEEDKLYPLTLSLCDKCKYIQCKQVITADELFKKNYFYYSSMIPSLVKHFTGLAEWISANFPKDTKIIEIGCNDGVLLYPLYEKGFKNIIGVDPSQTILKVSKNINTYNTYFDNKTVDDILSKYGLQDLFISCNSFAHIDNMQEIIYNMKRILHPSKGKAIIEVHYSKHIFDNKQFDFIYHEHMGYYTVTSLFNICKLNELRLSYVEEVANHGGSLRCIIEMKPTHIIPEHIQVWLDKEKLLFEEGFFNQYQIDLYKWKQKLKDVIDLLVSNGQKIYGYGASGRANTLLHFTEITLDYIIDDAPSKIGSYTPIYNIPIIDSKILYGDNKPDYVLILAWPYADFIMKTHKDFKGKFILPLPDIKIV
jgi:methylation protein EvaC